MIAAGARPTDGKGLSGRTDHWNSLVASCGTPFQTAEFCAAFEKAWPGRFEARHVECTAEGTLVGAAPAYLYAECPRLDYYRAVGLSHAVMLSHALVGWYGCPIGVDAARMAETVELFLQRAAADDAVAMFAGIDGRDAETLRVLAEARFEIGRFHTLMVRTLDPVWDRDPLARLRARYRHTRGAKIKRAVHQGVQWHLASAGERDAVVDLLVGTLDYHGTDKRILTREFLSELFERKLPGMETLVATDREGRAIGASVNFVWQHRYFTWLGGHRRDLLPTHCQSDLLYLVSIQRALELGCTEIEAGRSPYKPKLEYGFAPVPLMAAVRGASRRQHADAKRWLDALSARHVERYPEVQAVPLGTLGAP